MVNIENLKKLSEELFNWTEIFKIVAEHDNSGIPTEDSEKIYLLSLKLNDIADKLVFEFYKDEDEL